jgi:hypothetical protein
MGVNAVLLALKERLADTLRGVPFGHEVVEQRIEVRPPGKGVGAYHQAADFRVAEADLGK